MLEIKQKSGPYQLKRSLRLTREDAVCLAAGDYARCSAMTSPLRRSATPG